MKKNAENPTHNPSTLDSRDKLKTHVEYGKVRKKKMIWRQTNGRKEERKKIVKVRWAYMSRTWKEFGFLMTMSYM